jgi:hypothetical protein
VLALADGSVARSVSGTVSLVHDGGIYATASGEDGTVVAMTDVASGTEQWRVPGGANGLTVSAAGLHALSDDSVRTLAPSTGDEQWTQSVELFDPTPLGAAAGAFVYSAAPGGNATEFVARETESGERRWSRTLGGDDTLVIPQVARETGTGYALTSEAVVYAAIQAPLDTGEFAVAVRANDLADGSPLWDEVVLAPDDTSGSVTESLQSANVVATADRVYAAFALADTDRTFAIDLADGAMQAYDGYAATVTDRGLVTLTDDGAGLSLRVVPP